MIRRPPRSTQSRSSAASDVYKRQNATDEVARFLRMEVSPCIVTKSEMKWALERYFGIKSIVEQTLEKIKEREEIAAEDEEEEQELSLIHISEPTRLGMISYA